MKCDNEYKRPATALCNAGGLFVFNGSNSRHFTEET